MTPHTREEWGAKFGRGSLDPGAEPRVVIHHSYRPALLPTATKAEEVAAVRSIERYHVETNGWSAIGYNFLVAPSGRVYEGRGWQYKGSHAGPVNGLSIGNCLLIDGNVTEPSAVLIGATRELIAEGLALGEIAPDYTVSGHRDHMAGRTCPGDKVYARLREFRHDAGAVNALDDPVGTLRYSKKHGPIIVTQYTSDAAGEWAFCPLSEVVRLPGILAGSPLSSMPKHPFPTDGD